MFPFGRTATITPQTVDNMGDRTPGVPVAVEGCAVWETPGVETTGGQDTSVWSVTALMPVGTTVNITDRVEIDGVVYEVVAQPIAWKSDLTGHQPGVEVHLQTTSG